MPRIGDPSLRPAEGHVIIPSSPAMVAQAARLVNQAAVVWLGKTRPQVSAAEIRSALAVQARIDKDLVKVVPRYPEDFLATFEYKHYRDMVTALPGSFPHGELDIHAANWRETAHAEHVNMFHHVHLCVEGMSLQAWMEEGAVSRVLGPNTVIDYFDIATLQKEDATVLSLWAWTADPSAIPKVQWVTVSGPPAASSTIGRIGLQKRVIIHLDMHEDFTRAAMEWCRSSLTIPIASAGSWVRLMARGR
jgi:hypothetical protein